MPISFTQSTKGYWTERHLLQLQCSELQRGSRRPGGHFGKAPLHEHPVFLFCPSTSCSPCSMDLCSDPLWMLLRYNLSKKGSLKVKVCCVLGTSDRSSVEKLVLQQLSLFSSPHKEKLILLFFPICWEEKGTVVYIIHSNAGHIWRQTDASQLQFKNFSRKNISSICHFSGQITH